MTDPDATTTDRLRTSGSRTHGAWVWGILLAVLTLRLIYAAFQPFDLVEDESYYWDWGRQLSWGYYSKPPLIAWTMALATGIGGDNAVAIKFCAALLATAALGFIYLAGRSLYSPKAGFLALLLGLATPAQVALSSMMTIDVLLVFFWTAALWLFWRWVDGQGPAGLNLALLTVCTGLGILAKQMMMLFPLLALIYLAVTPDKRALLKRGSLWVAFLLAFLFLAPTVWWNARHDWITVQHTQHHFESAEAESLGVYLAKTPLRVLEFSGIQMALLSPLTWILLICLYVVALWQFRRLSSRGRYLAVFGAVPIVVIYLMSLRQVMQPNWPAVYYLPGFLLLAGWFSGEEPLPKMPAGLKKWKKPALAVGFCLVAFVMIYPLALGPLGYAGDKHLDPLHRQRGWKEAGTAVGELLTQVPNPEKTFVVALNHRLNASQMAFYLPQQPHVYRWEPTGTIRSQYELWPSPQDKKGWDAFIILNTDFAAEKRDAEKTGKDEKRVPLTPIRQAFKKFEEFGEISVEINPERSRDYRVFLGHDLIDWPPYHPDFVVRPEGEEKEDHGDSGHQASNPGDAEPEQE